jgi:hypothetical protein
MEGPDSSWWWQAAAANRLWQHPDKAIINAQWSRILAIIDHLRGDAE